MNFLAIETSCDETAVAILQDVSTNGRPAFRVLANLVASQDDIHQKFGGIVPELASRRHIETLPVLVPKALAQAGLSMADIAGLGVTREPGLMPALWVGVSYAKGLSLATQVPLVGVNHLAGHLAAVFLQDAEHPAMTLPWPHLSLIVSGGHTELFLGERGGYRHLAATLDDAAGEAFDKVAKMLGLGYPGGREIEKLARTFAPGTLADLPFKLPVPKFKNGKVAFSFSGLKTAVSLLIQKNPNIEKNAVAFAFQETVLNILAQGLEQAIAVYRPKALIFAGGVAANSRLRQGLAEICQKRGLSLLVPPMAWCTDNAAMIGAAGLLKWRAASRRIKKDKDGLRLKAQPQMDFSKQALREDFFPGVGVNARQKKK